ncbi:protein tyrosine phosphatase [Bradyrhizobium sp. CCBAU 51627]|nr:protein tyrosine phosphatase [Bradyrhizobium sp. CCBAU 51627]
MPPNAILFLCTGNYYRSRYAEELFNHLAKTKGLSWYAFSRGAAERGSPDNVGPMSVVALDRLRQKGIRPEGAARNPLPCSLADFDVAKIVIAVKEAEHRPLVESRFPTVASRVKYWDVDDVEFAHPSIALAKLDELVRELIENLQVR